MNLAKLGNDHWIARYAKGITILGILIIVGGVGYEVVVAWYMLSTFFAGVPNGVGMERWAIGAYVVKGVMLCVLGFLVIAMSQLLVYMIGSGQKPGRILRKASWGLFLMAGLSIGGAIFSVLFSQAHMTLAEQSSRDGFTFSWFHRWIVVGTWPLLSGCCKALVYLALGLVLRRALPVIEESKAVV